MFKLEDTLVAKILRNAHRKKEEKKKKQEKEKNAEYLVERESAVCCVCLLAWPTAVGG